MSERVLMEPHAHTKEVSRCGWLLADEVIGALSDHGYKAVVITDHYLPGQRTARQAREAFLEGYHKAVGAGRESGVTVLPGIEIRFGEKTEDFLVYGMGEEDIVSLPDDVCEQGLRHFHSLAKEKGWLIYQAHPFRSKQLPANPTDIDGMEIFNGNPRHNSQNRLAASFATRHNLRTIAGSDIHRPGDVGAAGLMTPVDALTPRGFADWLRATPHPRIRYQETPVNGILYRTGAVPGAPMVEALYEDAGWTEYSKAMKDSMAGLRNSSFIVTAWDDTALVGMARAVSDGHTVVYIQDILVLGAYQRRGIGRALMHRLLKAHPDVRQTVLVCDDSVETRGFYKACGFGNIADLNCVGYIRLRNLSR